VVPKALVTGASSGIGEAFARRLAADGYDVVVVARRRERLDLLREVGVATEVIVADLATPEGCAAVEERLAVGIDLLVNNAGISTGAAFEDSTVDTEERMLAVNVRAVMRLTHAAIPPMLAAGSGAVINVSSVAAYTAVAGFATYSASKSYVSAMSESLAVRYASRGVKVMALCPGFVRSEMHEQDEMPSRGITAKLMWLDPAQLVDIALRDLDRGRVVCMPGFTYKASVGVMKLLPRRVLMTAGKFANRGNQ
jgi:short-subunit dehydrogenase